MTDISSARVRWQCRRGMLELDLLLLPFFDACYAALSPALQHTFLELLDCPDPDIYNWFLGADLPPTHLTTLIQTLRDYHQQQHTAT